MTDFFHLAFLHFYVKGFLLVEELKNMVNFYQIRSFRACDWSLKKLYLFQNPYKISRQFLMSKGSQDIHQYGETPLAVYYRMAEECSISEKDLFFELGCGRGRGLFFLSCLTKCYAQGVDWVPHFTMKAQQVAFQHNLNKVSFICEDMYKVDLRRATVIYLYGTCLEDEEIVRIISILQNCSQDTQIVTVSYCLAEYSSFFVTIKEFKARFPWGKTTLYLQKKL